MKFFKNFFQKKEKMKTQKKGELNIVYAPLKGTVIPISQINDGVFSSGILGQGIGIYPEEEIIYAPFDGKIIQIADTKHAIGVLSNDNIELLIHVGMDTVAMNGEGFRMLVSEGEIVHCGQKLMIFSKDKIRTAGYMDTIAVIITNTDDFSVIKPLADGTVEKMNPVLFVK